MRNDVDEVRALIKSGRPVVASVAPSFAASFDCGAPGRETFPRFAAALRRLGFSDARETAEAAAAVTAGYEKLLAARTAPALISSACPVVVRLIERYYPETLPFLAAVVSPMTAHAKQIKSLQHGAAVVFIGPCLAKKNEAGWDPGAVDAALTFEELRGWFEEAGVAFSAEAFPAPEAARPAEEKHGHAESDPRFYPTRGGILKTMTERLPGVDYLSVGGIRSCREALESLAHGRLRGCFLEMAACENGCIAGPCMTSPTGGWIESARRVAEYIRRAPSTAADLPAVDLHRSFAPRPVVGAQPGEREISDILAKIGKKTKKDELNCGACGYSTCREKAVAVYQGKAELGMCMPYMRERAELISDSVIAFTPNAILVLNGALQVQALNRAAVTLFGAVNVQDIRGKYVGELTEEDLYEEAAVRRQNILGRKTYLYRNDRYVEQSVVCVPEHDIVFGIYKDLTDEQRQQERLGRVRLETVQTADRVIAKQMRIAQEIAMLLGESTAETKIALTKLKETLKPEEE